MVAEAREDDIGWDRERLTTRCKATITQEKVRGPRAGLRSLVLRGPLSLLLPSADGH